MKKALAATALAVALAFATPPSVSNAQAPGCIQWPSDGGAFRPAVCSIWRAPATPWLKAVAVHKHHTKHAAKHHHHHHNH